MELLSKLGETNSNNSRPNDVNVLGCSESKMAGELGQPMTSAARNALTANWLRSFDQQLSLT